LSQHALAGVRHPYHPRMSTVVYGIPHCDTVKKARAWLDMRGVDHRFHDFKKYGVPVDRLARWCEALGWEPLVNRKGTTWRKLDASAQGSVVDAQSACALMQAHPSVIKRPVVVWADGVTVGFDPAAWQRYLSR
jgi:Spx/MgsR family transcriptional regulator